MCTTAQEEKKKRKGGDPTGGEEGDCLGNAIKKMVASLVCVGLRDLERDVLIIKGVADNCRRD